MHLIWMYILNSHDDNFIFIWSHVFIMYVDDFIFYYIASFLWNQNFMNYIHYAFGVFQEIKMEIDLSTMYHCYFKSCISIKVMHACKNYIFSEIIYVKTNRKRFCNRLKMCKKGFIAFYENNNTRNAFNATL